MKRISSRKRHLRTLLSARLPLELRLKLAAGLFKKKKAFIFAAGPSLKRVDIEKLKEELEDALVICIKQSIKRVGDQCDVLLLNFCNFQEYRWALLDCPVLWTTFEPTQPQVIKDRGWKNNGIFTVVGNDENNFRGFKKSIAGSLQWNYFRLIEEAKAHWGPGLMYELAIPLALHTDVEEIYLVGWDIGDLRPNADDGFMNSHFYEHGELTHKTKITSLEIQFVARSTGDLKNWLNSLNKQIFVVSDSSAVDSSIERANKWIIC